MEYINALPKKSNVDAELDHLYRRFVSKCDYLSCIQREINLLKNEIESHEDELKRVNTEIIYWRDNYITKARRCKDTVKVTYAKFHNITDLFYPTNHNISSINDISRPLHLSRDDNDNDNDSDYDYDYEDNKDELREEDIGEFIRSMDSVVCTGDIIYIESLLKNSSERYAIISPDGELILHDDFMTIMFDKSKNTHNPEPYEFIKERNIKYGNMFKYIVKNKDTSIGEQAYKCCFNNWRTKDEVEEIIKYYIKKNLWM